MAKRTTLEHPKFARLKLVLSLDKFAVLGVLETLWQMVGRYTPQGNIGKYSDEEIEAWMEWRGEPGSLVSALVKCGWLDVCSTHRLVVHDWADHIDHTTATALKRAKLEPVKAQVLEQCSHSVRTVFAPPEPEPEPEPINPLTPNNNANTDKPRKRGPAVDHSEGIDPPPELALIPGFGDAWRARCAQRFSKSKTHFPTPDSVHAELAILCQCRDPIDVLRRATAGGWQGLNTDSRRDYGPRLIVHENDHPEGGRIRAL